MQHPDETQPRTANTRLNVLAAAFDERVRLGLELLQDLCTALGYPELTQYPPAWADHIVAGLLIDSGLPPERIWVFCRTGLIVSGLATPDQRAAYDRALAEWQRLDVDAQTVFAFDPMAYIREAFPLPEADERRLAAFMRQVHLCQRGLCAGSEKRRRAPRQRRS